MNQYRFREQLEHGDQARPWHLYRLGAIQGNVFPCHWHPEWELLIVQHGSLTLARNHTSVRLEAGEAVFLSATELHGGVSDDPDLVLHALVFQPGLLRSERHDAATELWIEPLESGALSINHVLSADSDPARIASQIVALIKKAGPGLELSVKGLLFQFLAEVLAAGQLQHCPKPILQDPISQIRAVLQLIEEQFAQPLTVDRLAAKAGLSPSHFARLFKAVTGDTPINQLIRRRIDEAARLLREGNLTVSEVAWQVGFVNSSYFSRTFRKHQGVNPSEMLQGR